MRTFFSLSIWALVAFVMLSFGSCGGNDTSFDNIVKERRSVRSYDATKKISEDEVRTLIATTQEAPSWANVQSPRYYVAISDEKLAEMRNAISGQNNKNVQDVPVIIVTTYKKRQSGFFDGQPQNEIGEGWGAYDTGLSNAYLILKAKEMGFDTLIMGDRDSEAIRKVLGIPSDETVMTVIALGYGAAKPARPGRKELREIVKFF